MSYDLAVFEPRQELRTREAFERWYDQTEEYGDDGSYNDPTQATPALQAWFHEIRELFVPLNGPYQLQDLSDPRNDRAADYNFGPDLIYVAFGWSLAEEAYAACFRLAEKHGVGFLDASGEQGAVWFPNPEGGGMETVHVHQAGEQDEV
jgi:hypothetical protein